MVKYIKYVLLVVMALALVVVSGCGKKEAAPNQELPKKLVIGLDDNFPPMGFHDEAGNLVGFDIDMAKEAAKRLNMEVEFKPIDWDSKEAELKSKRIDVIWNGLTITPEREKNMLFSTPYLKGDQIIVVKSDSPVQDKANLAGKVVAVQTGSSGEQAVKKDADAKSFKQVKEYGDFVTAFLDLEVGRIDAVVVDETVGRYLMKKKEGTFKVATGVFASEICGVGMRKEDVALKAAIDKVIKEMVADGTMDKLATKWFGNTSIIIKDNK